jgi:hypothetical protein
MRPGLALVTAVLLGLALAGPAAAQRSIPPGTTPPTAASGATVESVETEGAIAALDPTARVVRLDDGQEYVVPDSLGVNWNGLRAGAIVALRYSIDQGRNFVTSLRVRFP